MHLSNELAAERATRKTLAQELADLRDRAAQMEEEVVRARQAIERLQTRYRNADLARQRADKKFKSVHGRADQTPEADQPLFLDPETEFRFAVTLEWARRIPAAEKGGKPLAGYTIGPDFLESVAQAEGVSRAKVVAVVVEVLTGQVQHIAGRDLHQLRAGGAGGRYVRRDEAAVFGRVALQRVSPGARRLHYWRNGDHFELSRVVLHDDFRP
jgi:hypothetical protein